MYSQLIIQTKLDAVQAEIDKRSKDKQFSLTLFTIEESRHYVAEIDKRTIRDDKGKPLRIDNLTQQDLNFIENERRICQNNFLYWATHYAYIKSKLIDETEAIILFPPNIPQRIIHDQWSEMEEQFHAIMMLYLKARQGGVSTINELAIAHRVQFYERVNALVASSDPDKTKKMAGMMQLCWELQPFWLLPEYKIAASKEVWATFDNKSSVTCQHGTAMSGIARGDTPDIAHLSELPDFRNPIEDVDAALLNAIHENPSTFIVLESTAKGKTGQGEWWYDKWKYAKKWSRFGKSKFRPVFLPWFTFTDVWPTKTWCHQFLPSNLPEWQPKEATKAHMEKCKQYVSESPLLRRYLGNAYNVPIHQQYWWEFTRQEYEESGQLHKFLEEMPATDEEAFQRSGRGIITIEQAEWLRNHAKPLATYHNSQAVFGIIGDGIPPEDEPLVDHIDVTRPYITVKVEWLNDIKTYRFVPLKHDPDEWNNRLFIWQFPSPRDEIAIGVDGAEGLEGLGDNSTIEVIKKMTMIEPAEQIAEFVSNTLSTAELLPYLLAIGTFYSTISNETINQSTLVIESACGGHALQLQMRNAGWRAFHRWHGAYQQLKIKTPNTIGWETNAWTRPLLITQPIKAIKDGAFRINSSHLIEEIVNLQKDSDNNRIEAKGKDHDDRYFGSASAFFSLHQFELLLMSQGDGRARQMFTSFLDHMLQQEGLVVSLNDAIRQVEDKRGSTKDGTKGYNVDYMVGNFLLPTL